MALETRYTRRCLTHIGSHSWGVGVAGRACTSRKVRRRSPAWRRSLSRGWWWSTTRQPTRCCAGGDRPVDRPAAVAGEPGAGVVAGAPGRRARRPAEVVHRPVGPGDADRRCGRRDPSVGPARVNGLIALDETKTKGGSVTTNAPRVRSESRGLPWGEPTQRWACRLSRPCRAR
jgi:hypothetical protein